MLKTFILINLKNRQQRRKKGQHQKGEKKKKKMMGTISERRIEDITSKEGLWGSTLLQKQTQLSQPSMIAIDYDPVINGGRAMASRKLKRTEIDAAVLRRIQEAVYRKTKHIRKCFTMMMRNPDPEKAPGAKTVSINQFMKQLDIWEIDYNPEQIKRTLGAYEAYPGEGIEYSDFTDIIGNESLENVADRRDAHGNLLTAQSKTKKAITTQSNVLMTTSASVPQGKYSNYDKTIDLYGSGNGLDINMDGTNNGYFVMK
eukprot:TRINITY_DN11129_c0_g2_i1.p2 TRINITY_DN11129_c0_g2~~TRINITY_DN11129_c0_g2_i1.p2  ORF type:complete len:258 (+),score=46.14 TRINITY_DN11129_c0_g2_i1:1394-2167(+)